MKMHILRIRFEDFMLLLILLMGKNAAKIIPRVSPQFKSKMMQFKFEYRTEITAR